MRKILYATASCLLAFSAQAQMVPQNNNGPYSYSYAQDRVNQGYSAPVPYQYAGYYYAQDPRVVAAPRSPQVYGFYQQPVQQNYNANAPRPQMMWYPTQQQRFAASEPVYMAAPSYDMYQQEQRPDVYQSPVYNSQAVRQGKDWYADLHLGVGGTLGWKGDFDTPIGPVWGIAIGKRVLPNVRVDVEFNYHTKADLVDNDTGSIEYQQYDLGANVYYDFPVRSHLPVKPFVGAGVWGVKGKASASSYNGKKLATADAKVKLGLSAAAGVIYPINDMFSVLAMARARYIVADENLYNIEGLIGLRYHF